MEAAGASSATAASTPRSAEAAKKTTQKRAAVSAEASSSEEVSYSKVVYQKTEEARQFIMMVVADSTLFAGASSSQRTELVDAMQERTCGVDELIIQQGDPGEHYFVVRSGEYAVYLKQKGDTPVHKYKPGGTFGELALLYNKPRAATVKCVTPGVLYQLDRGTFRGVLIAGQKSTGDASLRILKKVPLLEGLTDQQYNQLLSVLTEEKYEDEQIVCEQGASMDSLYLVKEGLVNLVEGSSTAAPGSGAVVPYQAGDFFGASALSDDGTNKWFGAISAVGTVTLLRLKRSDMLEVLGDLTTLLRDNFQQRVLGSIEMFKMLSGSQISALVDSFTEQRYTASDKVITQGDEGDTFYIIKSGQVRVSVKSAPLMTGEREIATLKQGDYFGEMALLNAAPRMATVTAIEPTICMTVDRTTFDKVLGPLKELMDREADRRKAEVEALSKKAVIKLSELKDLGTLGVGTFGRVKLVDHLPTGSKYALKCMRKRQLIALKQVEHVLNEKNLLALCDHPFLINMVGAYQDGVELYMLLELALGGELFSRLRDLYRFDENASRFYAACVTSAFTHMHDNKIVYRDLKPENLLLDSEGYIKICDFGFAKIVPERTFTLCGTPEYLAPEIISNVGHTLAVDWWALGILIFELLTGDPPFVADDPMELYQLILRGTFAYPSLVGRNAKDIITNLLVNNPAKRLGIVLRGHRHLMAHAFYKPIDFALLVKKAGKPPPPHVPKIKSDADMSNFDELEDGAGSAQDPTWDQACSPEENALFAAFSS